MHSLTMYAPAETRIGQSAFVYALCGSDDSFDKDLRSYLHSEECVLACSGRALMTLLLEVLKKADAHNRDEVLIPGYTCYSVAASVARAGLRISLYDLDPKTLRPDTDSLSRAAGDRTLAIVYQHLFGIPQPREDFQEVAARYGVPLIEDAAQGLGGSLNGMPMGGMGDFGILSFGRGKPLPIGGGGALTGKKDILDTLPPLKSPKGWHRLALAMATQVLSHPLLYGIMERLPLGLGTTVFDPGFAMAGMPSAVKKLAKGALTGMEACNAHRRSIAGVYRSMLGSSRTVAETGGSMPVYTRFPFFGGPEKIGTELFRLGVRRMYPEAISGEPATKEYLAPHVQPVPGARQIARDLMTLPTHGRITPGMAGRISLMLREEYRC